MGFTKVFVKYNTALSACQDFQSDTEKHKDQMGPEMFTMSFSLPHSVQTEILQKTGFSFIYNETS